MSKDCAILEFRFDAGSQEREDISQSEKCTEFRHLICCASLRNQINGQNRKASIAMTLHPLFLYVTIWLII